MGRYIGGSLPCVLTEVGSVAWEEVTGSWSAKLAKPKLILSTISDTGSGVNWPVGLWAALPTTSIGEVS